MFFHLSYSILYWKCYQCKGKKKKWKAYRLERKNYNSMLADDIIVYTKNFKIPQSVNKWIQQGWWQNTLMSTNYPWDQRAKRTKINGKLYLVHESKIQYCEDVSFSQTDHNLKQNIRKHFCKKWTSWLHNLYGKIYVEND